MKLLLDTNSFLWFIMGERRLGPNAREAVETGDCVISELSLLEISLKASKGKLIVTTNPGQAIRELGFERTGISDRHLARMERLPLHHRDPFDRYLIAQALSDNLPILTSDRAFAQYGVTVIDATR